MHVYSIISRKNKLEALLTVYRSGNGCVCLRRPIRRFYRFADRLEQEFPLQVDSASLSDELHGNLCFTSKSDGLLKKLLTRLDKILDEIG